MQSLIFATLLASSALGAIEPIGPIVPTPPSNLPTWTPTTTASSNSTTTVPLPSDRPSPLHERMPVSANWTHPHSHWPRSVVGSPISAPKSISTSVSASASASVTVQPGPVSGNWTHPHHYRPAPTSWPSANATTSTLPRPTGGPIPEKMYHHPYPSSNYTRPAAPSLTRSGPASFSHPAPHTLNYTHTMPAPTGQPPKFEHSWSRSATWTQTAHPTHSAPANYTWVRPSATVSGFKTVVV